MTHFEYAVLTLFALFCATNMMKAAQSENVWKLPRWYLAALPTRS